MMWQWISTQKNYKNHRYSQKKWTHSESQIHKRGYNMHSRPISFFFLPSLGYKPAGPSIPLMSEKTLSHKFFYHFCCHLMGWGKIEKWLFLFYVMCFFFQPSSILLTCVSITISGSWPVHLCGVMVILGRHQWAESKAL